MNLDNFLKRIKELGLTMKNVSDGTGIATTVLSDWKNGKAVPTVAKFELVADYLDCTVDYLIGRTDVVKPINVPKAIVNKFVGVFDDYIDINDIVYLPRMSKLYCVREDNMPKIKQIYDVAKSYDPSIMEWEQFDAMFDHYNNFLYKLLNADCAAIDAQGYFELMKINDRYVEYYFKKSIEKL